MQIPSIISKFDKNSKFAIISYSSVENIIEQKTK